MGLFDRGPGKGTPFDWLVVGLGNPGPKYAPRDTTSAKRWSGSSPTGRRLR